MKKSKCIKLEQWGQADQYGNYSHNIEFEDGTSGSYRGNPTKGLAFKIGEEAEYVSEKKTSGAGKEYLKISKPQKEFGGGGGYKPDVAGMTVGAALNNVALLMAHKVITIKEAEATAEWFINRAIKLKEKYSEKIK